MKPLIMAGRLYGIIIMIIIASVERDAFLVVVPTKFLHIIIHSPEEEERRKWGQIKLITIHKSAHYVRQDETCWFFG